MHSSVHLPLLLPRVFLLAHLLFVVNANAQMPTAQLSNAQCKCQMLNAKCTNAQMPTASVYLRCIFNFMLLLLLLFVCCCCRCYIALPKAPVRRVCTRLLGSASSSFRQQIVCCSLQDLVGTYHWHLALCISHLCISHLAFVHLACGIWHVAFGIWHLAFGVWYCAFGI